MAAAKGSSVVAAIVVVLPDLDGINTIGEELKNSIKHCFVLLRTGFGKSNS